MFTRRAEAKIPEISPSKILAFGDSHSCFWTGENKVPIGFFNSSAFKGIDVLHLGPITAHGISNLSGIHAGLKSVTDYLSIQKKVYGCLIFCFGEIDCRCHIVRLEVRENRSIDQVATETARRYFMFAERLISQQDIPGIIWGPIPSMMDSFSFNPDFPTVGSPLERNYATYIFNKTLTQLSSEQSRIYHVNLLDDMINSQFVTRSDLLFDGRHLSNNFIQQARSKLHTAIIEVGARNTIDSIDRIWPIYSTAKIENIGIGKSYGISKNYPIGEEGPFSESRLGSWQFDTDLDELPSIIVDLGGAYFIERLVIHNDRNHPERARSIEVATSMNDVDYTPAFAPPSNEWVTFDASEQALVVDLKSNTLSRFIKFYFREAKPLQLSDVEIYAKSFTGGL